MSNGSDIAAEIATALADVGTDAGEGPLVATIKRAQIDAAVNPWEPTSQVDPTEYEINIIRDAWTRSELSGTSILATDLKLMAAAGTVVPEIADALTIGDETYNIMSVMPEAVGGVDLFYIIQARK